MTKRIPLTQGKYALVDDDMFEQLNAHKWCAARTGHNGTWYAMRKSDKKILYMHRQIMNPPKGLQVDHINLDNFDNRRSNLRICTHSQNQQNRRTHKDNKAGFKGVTWHAGGRKWQANICINHKMVYLGLFPDPISAARAYDAAALKYFGEFARTNFPQEVRESC